MLGILTTRKSPLSSISKLEKLPSVPFAEAAEQTTIPETAAENTAEV